MLCISIVRSLFSIIIVVIKQSFIAGQHYMSACFIMAVN
jgi:hypothetical protein